MIEFGNRPLGIGVVAVSILMFLGAVLARTQRRRDVLLALTMPLGVALGTGREAIGPSGSQGTGRRV